MSKRHTDSTPDEKAPKRRKLSAASVLVEAARNGDTTAVRAGLEKLIPDTDSKTVAFDAVHEACRGNHDECLALLLPYVETTQMGFGMLLSECIHADHTACTEVLLQHWKSVCSNVAFVPHGQEADIQSKKPRPCPAMWEDPAVCQVLIDAGADIETKDEDGRSPLLRASVSGKFAVVKMLVEAGAGVCVTDTKGDTCLPLAAYFGHTETVRYLVVLPEVDVNHAENNGYTALHIAVQQQFPDVVCLLIDAGADIEVKSKVGRSPLLLASTTGHLDIVKMLVEAGAGVCVSDSHRYTCLIIASGSGHTETVRYLVGLKDVDVNHTNCGHTALHFAVMRNHPGVVEVLFEAGADIEVKDEEGSSPLLLACTTGHLDIVKMLVEAGAGVRGSNIEGVTCLLRAAYHGHTEIVRYLVGLPQVDVNQLGCKDLNLTALHLAVVGKHQDIVKVLIDAGAELDRTGEDGRSALLVASCMDMPDIVKMLVEAGAVVRATDNKGRTCLTLASYFGHTETVRYLAGLKDVEVSHPDADGYTALHFAVQQQFPDVVQELIDAGADIEANNKDKSSPLLLASRSGSFDIVKMLVEAGSGVRVTDNKGDTCLPLASYFGHTETVRYLVGLKDVDVNHSENNGYTALHFAVQQQFPDVVKVLIDAGAELDRTDEDGRSALLMACCVDMTDIVKMLVEAGAGVRATDNKGRTCLTLASCHGRTETVRYLAGLKDVEVNHPDADGYTALHFAVQQQFPDVVQELIDAGADIEANNKDKSSPLLLASRSGSFDIVKMLVEAGAGVRVTDNKGDTCLTIAAAVAQEENVRNLLRLLFSLPPEERVPAAIDFLSKLRQHAHGTVQATTSQGDNSHRDVAKSAMPGLMEVFRRMSEEPSVAAQSPVPKLESPDEQDSTSLSTKAPARYVDTVRYLVGLPEVDVNHVNNCGETALHFAVRLPYPDLVQELIAAGADVETKNKDGRSALLLTSMFGKLDIVKMLIGAGAGVCVTDNKGATCLTLAANGGHTDMVHYLVGLPEVDVNHAGENGMTSLHGAVLRKRAEVVQVLIGAGADIERRDNLGRSPLLCASECGGLEVARMLVEAGAGVRITDKDGDTCLILAAHFGHTETVRYLVGLKDVDVHHQGMNNLRCRMRWRKDTPMWCRC